MAQERLVIGLTDDVRELMVHLEQVGVKLCGNINQFAASYQSVVAEKVSLEAERALAGIIRNSEVLSEAVSLLKSALARIDTNCPP